MRSNFEYETALAYRVKALTNQVNTFKSGEKYVRLLEQQRNSAQKYQHEINTLKLALANANASLVTMRNKWEEVFEDIEKENRKKEKQLLSKINVLKKELAKYWNLCTELREKLHVKTLRIYELETINEELNGTIKSLKAQINRDYENSSTPSSQKINRKKIVNSREKTGRTPGGQWGHVGYKRPKLEPTTILEISIPEEYNDHTQYKPTGKMISKQLVKLEVQVIVEEYRTPEYRKISTNSRVHAAFPEGLVNEVTYDSSVKAFCFTLNTVGGMSIEKVQEFIQGITNDKLKPSTGMINKLCEEFSKKTAHQRKEAINNLLLSPVVNTDFTPVRINGKLEQILVCANEETTIYLHREKKGHEGIIGTPIEDYQGILVHDHDTTFYKYGSDHQECLAHILRYLKDSIQNESHLTWNSAMQSLLQEMIHARNQLDSEEEMEMTKIKEFEQKYHTILEKAKEEYEYEPASPYYVEGFNLFKRLGKYDRNHLLFLHDRRVPTTNNRSERLLRCIKRKQRQVMSFRSSDSVSYLCDSLSMIALLRPKEENTYQATVNCFD